jgi:hypothetical protein
LREARDHHTGQSRAREPLAIVPPVILDERTLSRNRSTAISGLGVQARAPVSRERAAYRVGLGTGEARGGGADTRDSQAVKAFAASSGVVP